MLTSHGFNCEDLQRPERFAPGPSRMHAQLPASPDDIDLSALWAAVRRVLPKLLIAALAVGVASFAVLSLLTPKYASQAQIEIVSKGLGNPFEPRRDTSAPEMVSVRMDKEAIATHVRALLSSDLALKLAAELHLADEARVQQRARRARPVRQVPASDRPGRDRAPARARTSGCSPPTTMRCASTRSRTRAAS